MKLYLVSILFVCSAINTTHANTLIITRGPVCQAMGSYLSNAIKSVDNSYYSLSQIDVSNAVYYQLFNELFPQEMAIITNAIEPENVSYAVTNNYVYFKETAYWQQQQQALDAIAYIQNTINDPAHEHIYTDLLNSIKHLVMADLAYHAACKHNVVLEGGTIINFEDDTAHIRNSFDTVVETINYCPPTDMIELWQQKETMAINEKKAYKRRLLKQVLTSFFNNFIPTENESDAIIILTKDEFDMIINQAIDYIQIAPEEELIQDGTFTRAEFTLDELAYFREMIYAKYNFDEVDYVSLVPTLSYDILLSSKQDCLNLAQRIANGEF